MRSVSKCSVRRRIIHAVTAYVGLPIIVASIFACNRPNPSPPEVNAILNAPSPICTYTETAFRSGVNPPEQLVRVAPDLTGVPVPEGEHLAIVELRLDVAGAVAGACVLRGVRDDIDRRVLAAVRRWRFEPARLKHDATVRGERLKQGTIVPIFMTVTVRVGVH